MAWEPITITRTIHGEEIRIELDWSEMWQAREVAEIRNCAEEINGLFERDIPEDDLLEYANAMRDYMVYNDYGYSEARDLVCEDYDLWDLYSDE